MFHSVHFNELFPTKRSLGIFFTYIALFVNQGLLVTASQETNNSYKYNTIVAVLLTEVIKLLVCVILYSLNNPVLSIFSETKKNLRILGLYFVPSVLYCIYNNLTYINLSTFDPTTYFILLQLRVVITGFIFQSIFKKELTRKQWLSLVLLTFGCMMKQVYFGDENKEESETHNKQLNVTFSASSLFILAQIMCSCFAGVYNEHLLKKNETELNVYIQNMFMYVDSIICNIGVLIWDGNLFTTLSYDTLVPFYNFKVMLVVFNNAAIGIVTSFFLHSLNSILKTFASALELVFTAILSRLLFSIPINVNTALAICIIITATILYSQNPVNNSRVTEKTDKILQRV